MASKTPFYAKFQGEMLTPLQVDSERECTSKDSASDHESKNRHELIIDFRKPLQEVMRAICSHHGKLIMAFPPGSSVKIKFTNYGRQGDQDASEVGAHYPDIKSELAEIFVETVPQYKTQIKNKLEYHGYHPSDNDIKVVKLISSAGDEALSVDLEDKRVYFKVFTRNTQDLDDTSIFIRVIIDHDDETMMIWINLSTLLPIARESDNNNLYAIVPQFNILPPINSQQRSTVSQDQLNDPFHWLDSILQSPGDYTTICFFYEDGAGSGHVKIHPFKDPPESLSMHTQGDTMICKAAAEVNANAVIGTSLMQFTIYHYDFEEVLEPSNSNNHYSHFRNSCVTL